MIMQNYFDKTTGQVEVEKIQATNKPLNTKEVELAEKIMDRFKEMKQWRENSCKFGSRELYTTAEDDETGEVQKATATYSSGGQTGTNNWAMRWKRDWDLWSMQTGKNRYASELPSVSSPIIFSTMQAILAQFQDGNTTAVFENQVGTPKVVSKIASLWLENWENKTNIQQTFKNPSFLETVLCGTSISYNSRVKRVRNVKMFKREEELVKEIEDGMQAIAMEDGQEINMQEMVAMKLQQLKDENINELVFEKEIVDYDDFFCEKVPLKDFYIDPSATEINGLFRDAQDCIWEQVLPIQKVIEEYSNFNDPFIIKKNINKELILTAVGTSIEKKAETHQVAEGYNGEDVRIIRYYNKFTDSYVIVANDTIIRDGPLPYNHKLLPFSKFTAIPVEGSFYGVGFGILLEDLQMQDELINSLVNYINVYNANLPATFINQTEKLDSELKETMEKEGLKANQFIEIGTGDSITQMQPKVLPQDIWRMAEDRAERRTQISGVSPLLIGIPTDPNNAVRNNLINQESSLLIIRMLVNNWGKGWEDAITQAIHILQQTEPLSYTLIKDNANKDTQNQAVNQQLKQYRIMPNNKTLFRDFEELADTDQIELTPEITDYFDRLSVQLRIETTALASKQQQAQLAEDTLTIAIQILGNPNLVNNKPVKLLLKDFLVKRGVDTQITELIEQDETEEQDLLADTQNQAMLEGSSMPSIAGMTESHKGKHITLIMDIISKIEENNIILEQNPMDQNLAMQNQEYKIILTRLYKHLRGDIQEQSDNDVASVKMAEEALMPPAMPQQMQDPNTADPNQPQEPQQEQIPMNQIPQI